METRRRKPHQRDADVRLIDGPSRSRSATNASADGGPRGIQPLAPARPGRI